MERSLSCSFGRNSTLVIVFTMLLAGAGCVQPQVEESKAENSVGVLPASEDADPIIQGRKTYETFCMSCHGESAKGDGRLAGLLKVPPPDLTKLTEKYGTYPIDYVYETIDGRKALGSHGTRQMPVWGNVWTDQEGGTDAEGEVRIQINELVEYLRSLQPTSESD